MTYKLIRKVLIANRGEIAVRILRTCRAMGIATLALYEEHERGALHVRLADACVKLESSDPGGHRLGFLDQDAILNIAQEHQVDAIHPGYGFLTEREDFIQKCEAAGITFIGPPGDVVARLRQKVQVLQRARAAGFPTPLFSELEDQAFDPLPGYPLGAPADSLGAVTDASLQSAAEALGYPLAIKSCRGGRGRGERLVWSSNRLRRAIQRAQAEAQTVYGDRRVYFEQAILPAHQLGVQIIADQYGNLVHLGEREGSLMMGNQKIIEEAPSPSLSATQRQDLWDMAVKIARLFQVQNVVTVEFLMDTRGNFFFTEIKPRIQIEHPLTEMLTRVDLVKQQILLAVGERLEFQQQDIHLQGWAVHCRVRAEDPWMQFMPSPGTQHRVRLPGGADVRVDTYLYAGCEIPTQYDPLIAKLATWGMDRPAAVQRMRQALQEFQLTGAANNLSLVHQMLELPGFQQGKYTTEYLLELPAHDFQDQVDSQDLVEGSNSSARTQNLRNLAVIAALAYVRRNQERQPQTPARLLSGWHRDSRQLPS